jgi:hypothetical protein
MRITDPEQRTEDDVQILDISNEKYHEMPGWSSSQIKLLPDDPMLFNGRYISKTMPFQRTPAMELGTAIHRALLDGTPTMVIPSDVLSKSGAKSGNAWKEFRAEHESSNVLVKSEDDAICHILANLRAHKIVWQLLDASVFREQSIVWTDEETGLDLRARPDDVARIAGSNILWDLKTTADTSRRACQKTLSSMGYHRSLDHYATGLGKASAADLFDNANMGIDRHLIVWVNTSPPYDVVVDPISERALVRAYEQNEDAKADLAQRLCLHAGGDPEAWLPTDYHLIQPELDLPEWEYTKEV